MFLLFQVDNRVPHPFPIHYIASNNLLLPCIVTQLPAMAKITEEVIIEKGTPKVKDLEQIKSLK